MPSKKQPEQAEQPERPKHHPIFKPEGVELLLKVKQELLEHPEQFDMADWFWVDGMPPRGMGSNTSTNEALAQKLYNKSLQDGTPVCGSTACIAGHMAIMGGFRDWSLKSPELMTLQDWCRGMLFVEPHLQLPSTGLIPLFYLGMWPMRLRSAYVRAVEADDKARCVEAAAAAIDLFLHNPHGFRYADMPALWQE